MQGKCPYLGICQAQVFTALNFNLSQILSLGVVFHAYVVLLPAFEVVVGGF